MPTRVFSVPPLLKNWLTHTWVQFLLVFCMVSLVRFWPVFFQAETLYFGDNYSLLVPGKMFTAEWLRQGVVPLWNPYVMGGISWVGDVTQSVFYPTTLLFLVFPPAIALNLTILSHQLLTMVGMYFLARWFSRHHLISLAVSVLWMVSSQVTGSLHNLATMQSLAWFPVVLAASLGVHHSLKRALVMAGLFALQLLAGYPQHLLLAVPAAGVLSLLALEEERDLSLSSLWKWFKHWLFIGLVSLGLSAWLLWPFVTTLSTSTRMIQTTAQATAGSLHPVELAKFLVPYLFDAPAVGMRWGPSWNAFPAFVPYVTLFGALVLGCSIWSRWKDAPARWLLSLAVLVTGVALGSYIPGFTTVLDSIPWLKTVRYPSSLLALTTVFLLLLLARCLPQFRLKPKPTRILMGLGIIGAVGSVVALLLVSFNPGWVWSMLNMATGGVLATSPFHTVERDQVILQVLFASLSVNLGLTALAVWSWHKKKQWVWLAVVVVEAVFNTQALMFFAPNHVYQPPQAAELLQTVRDPQVRTLTRNFNRPYTDFGSYWEALTVRWPFSDSFIDQQELESAQYLQRMKDGLTPDWHMVAQVPAVNGYVTMVPLEYQRGWSSPGADPRINSLPELELSNPLLKNWAVRYYIVDEWFEVKEDLSTYNQVLQSYPWTVYQLESLSRFRLANDQTVELRDFNENPNQVSFSFENTSNQLYLKIADRYESGWQARVNDQPVFVENWDGMRAIPIASGQNRVELFYSPQSLTMGLAVSSVTAGLLILGGAYRYLKSKRAKS